MREILAAIRPANEVAFSRIEYGARLSRIRQSMQRAGIDCLYLSAPESLHYVSGYTCMWYQANSPQVWLPASGIAVHVEHDYFIHFEHVQEQTLIALTAISEDVRLTAAEGVAQQAFIVDELRTSGWLKGVVGLEMACYRPPRAFSESFQRMLESAGAVVKDATAIVRKVRRAKSAEERKYVRKAQSIADIGMAAARNAIGPGVTELEVYGAMVNAMACAGGEVTAIPCPVVSGPRAATVHAIAGRRVIQAGDIVNVDLCGVYNRYHANMARCFSVGEPHPDVGQSISLVYGAVDVVARMIEPNLPVRTLLERLEEYYRLSGILGKQWWVGGYELGVSFSPDWVGGFIYSLGEDAGDAVFGPGEVVNFEANFYLPQQAGIAFCINTVLFEEEHAEFLHATPAQLTVV